MFEPDKHKEKTRDIERERERERELHRRCMQTEAGGKTETDR